VRNVFLSLGSKRLLIARATTERDDDNFSLFGGMPARATGLRSSVLPKAMAAPVRKNSRRLQASWRASSW